MFHSISSLFLGRYTCHRYGNDMVAFLRDNPLNLFDHCVLQAVV